MLESFLQTLAQDLCLEEFPKKENQEGYLVTINSETKVSIQKRDPGFCFWAPIGPLPAERKEELFLLLMRANFLGQGTGGAVIGLDGNENFLTLSSVLPYDMNYKSFKDALEDFVNYLDHWKEELIRHKNTGNP